MSVRIIKKAGLLAIIPIIITAFLSCNDRGLLDLEGEKELDKSKPHKQSLLSKIVKEKRIIFATRNAPTTYYEGAEGAQGFEYDLARDFADAFGAEAEFLVLDTVEEVIAAVEKGKAHIAAAGITITPERKEKYRFSKPYHKVRQQIVCHRSLKAPEKIEDLIGLRLAVAIGSSYEQNLQKLKKQNPQLEWIRDLENTTELLLYQVSEKQIDCTVADSNIVRINRRYYPQLEVAFTISDEQQLAWILPKNAEKLLEAHNFWLKRYKKNGKVSDLVDRYYGHFEKFDYVNLMVFHRRIKSRLPEYRDMFEKAGKKFNITWTLLAAQSYQESHWDPKATSPTGVRGLMMLTWRTARAMGYESRIDPESSIFGGAKYLNKLLGQVSPNVQGHDRMLFALAAYNVGMGHVHDAQKLSRELGKNPNKWQDLRTVLPLLSEKKYYRRTRYGYARGTEPVRYVQRILEFQGILDKMVHKEMEILMGQDINLPL
ncbi:MAG: membrane-bound lytic murein transglycosylase MltF [Gammaproteobacteria bacterium]|nr:MAG: membrane-bound lytic murein transglycosylase MltF [Gammaproteobacteria bacterium]